MEESRNVDASDKMTGLALILQSSRDFVVWSLIVTTLGMGVAIWWLWHWLSLLGTVAFWICIASFILYASNRIHEHYHEAVARGQQTRILKLQTEQAFWKMELLKAKVEAHREVPYIVREGVASGKNVEYGGAKISDWKSHISMLPQASETKLLEMPNVVLPAKTEMIEVARRHDFTQDNIFLALAEQGDITTSIEGYVHCANDGSTGTGKTSNWRGQLVQFLKAGVDCILLNPHFASMTKRGEDWRPIAKALELQGGYGLELPRVLTKFGNIGTCLEWVATVEIDRRFEMLRQGCYDYKPLYLYIDELPAIADNCKEAPSHLRTILQRGRAVEVCVSVNSQGFLANDTDLKGSARENFDTAFFMGGSTYSGAKMLDLKEATLKDMLAASPEPLGKGVAFLRNNAACSTAQLVRLPYADNDFVYHVLGQANEYRIPPENEALVESFQTTSDLDKVYEACTRLKEEGVKVTVDRVAELLPFSRGKVGGLMKDLKEQGCVVK